MTKQLKKLLCIFLMTRKINTGESISYIHGWKTMGWGGKQLQEMPFPGACSTVLELSSSTQRTFCLRHRGQVLTAPCRCYSTMGLHHCGLSEQSAQWSHFQWSPHLLPPPTTEVRERESVLWPRAHQYLGLTAPKSQTVLFNSYFIVHIYSKQSSKHTSVRARPKHRDGLEPKAPYQS